MAVVSGWWPSVNGDRKYYIEQQAAVNAQIYSNGVLPVGEQFQVLVTEGLKLKVTAGYAWLNGYWILNDSDYMLTVDAPDGILNRIDRIVLQWNRENRETAIVVKKGAYSSDAAAPELQRDADAYELCIAQINVTAGATAITQADVTDTRPDSALCGLSSVYDPPDSTAWFAQFSASYSRWQSGVEAEYDAWIAQELVNFEAQQEEFNTWYQGVKDLLDEEVAVQLSNRIDDLETRIPTALIQQTIRTTVVMEADDWCEATDIAELPDGVETNGRFAYMIEDSAITASTDVDFVFADAQKGKYAFTFLNPVEGGVFVIADTVPDEAVTLTMTVYTVTE